MSKHNQRQEYGKTLVELGHENQNIVALEADLGLSTMSSLFGKEFPERYFEMGIAEQDMTSFAAGLALGGKIPFVNSFAVFASGRAYDQIRQSICTANLPVRIVGSSSGLSDFGDGATHQAIDDIAIMSVLPNMTVLTPCDGIETRKAVRWAAAAEGPVYIRLSRNDLPDVFPENGEYDPKKPVVVREGTDAVIFSIGIMIHEALKAAEMLQTEGISVKVVHIPAVKPMDEAAVRSAAEGAKAIVSCEECSIYGGLGMQLSYIFRGTGIPMEAVAVMDRFGQSAHSHAELLEAYGLTAPHIAEAVKKALK